MLMVKKLIKEYLKESLKWAETLFIAFLNSNLSVFKLHFGFTIKVLVAFAVVNILKNNLGTPITCISDSSLNDIIDQYCSNIRRHIIPASITTATSSATMAPHVNMTESKVTYYYQSHRWILFMIVLQAIFFYVPYYITKIFEGDLLDVLNPNSIVERQHHQQRDLDQVQDEEQLQNSLHRKRNVDYFARNFEKHSWYANTYIICEVLNLANVILQLSLINYFFIGNGDRFVDPQNIFHLVGNPKKRNDLLEMSLPQFTKCVFYKDGPGGRTVEYDTECVLAINSTNQLTIAVLSFWYFLLIILSGFALLSRLIVCCSPQMRKKILKALAISNPTDESDFEILFKKCHYGDWFILYQLKKRSNSVAYIKFVQELCVIIKND